MSAYVIVGFTPKDNKQLQAYSTSAAPIIAQYEGEFLAKGPMQNLHGDYSYTHQVIIAFPTREIAESWYASKEYQNIIPLREEGMNAQFQLLG